MRIFAQEVRPLSRSQKVLPDLRTPLKRRAQIWFWDRDRGRTFRTKIRIWAYLGPALHRRHLDNRMAYLTVHCLSGGMSALLFCNALSESSFLVVQTLATGV
jgi:hypothetical protein